MDLCEVLALILLIFLELHQIENKCSIECIELTRLTVNGSVMREKVY